MKIRNATFLDLDELAYIESLCFDEDDRADIKAIKDRLTYYGSHFKVLEVDNKIIGFINGLVTNKMNLTDDLYKDASLHNKLGINQMIFSLSIHPDFRNKGYARILLNEFIRCAILEYRMYVTLTCREHLIPFYEQFGFKNLGISCSNHGHKVWYEMQLKLR